MQFLETANMEKMDGQPSSYLEGCKDWNAYYPKHAAYMKEEGDSGL